MKQYFKNGIALLIPITLVVWIIMLIYSKGKLIVDLLVPATWGNEWWYPILGIMVVVLVIMIIGMVFSIITPLKWLFKKTEDIIITRIPVVNKIYGFGKEIVDSFVTDIKEDGELQVIEIDFGGLKSLGVLTDEEHNLGFLLSAPSPFTGFVFKLPNYRKLDMTFMEAVQINTSLGRIGGEKWVSIFEEIENKKGVVK